MKPRIIVSVLMVSACLIQCANERKTPSNEAAIRLRIGSSYNAVSDIIVNAGWIFDSETESSDGFISRHFSGIHFAGIHNSLIAILTFDNGILAHFYIREEPSFIPLSSKAAHNMEDFNQLANVIQSAYGNPSSIDTSAIIRSNNVMDSTFFIVWNDTNVGGKVVAFYSLTFNALSGSLGFSSSWLLKDSVSIYKD